MTDVFSDFHPGKTFFMRDIRGASSARTPKKHQIDGSDCMAA